MTIYPGHFEPKIRRSNETTLRMSGHIDTLDYKPSL